MATSKVYQNLVGSTKKAKFPAVMGSELSVNMYYARNGKQEYMESLPGLRKLSRIGGRCRGCYVSTIGLKSEASPEDMFAVMGNVLYRVVADGSATRIGVIAATAPGRSCSSRTARPCGTTTFSRAARSSQSSYRNA